MAGFVRPVGAYGRFSGSIAEQKYVDTQPVAGAIANGPMVFQMDDILEIPTGTGPNERIGRKIKLTHMSLDISVTTACTFATPHNKVRLRVWLDKQCNGVAAVLADVYDATIAALCLGTQAPLNLFNEGRFVLLGESSRTIENSQDSTGAMANNAIPNLNQYQVNQLLQQLWHCALEVPLSQVIEYSGPTGQINEIRSNQIFVEVSSDYTGVSAIYRGNVRVRYTDV